MVKRIMISGPHTRATARAGSKGRPGSKAVTTPTLPSHAGPAVSTVVSTCTPASRQRARSSAKTIWSGARAPSTTATRPPSGARSPPRRAASVSTAPRSGASPIPPATTTTSDAAEVVEPPVGAEGPAHPDDTADRDLAQRVGDRPHGAHGVLDRRPRARRAAHRDGHLADTEGREHVELARPEVRCRTGGRGQLEGHDVAGLAAPGHDAIGHRGQWVAPWCEGLSRGHGRRRGRGAGAGWPGGGRASPRRTRCMSS